jgi:DNA processing protein
MNMSLSPNTQAILLLTAPLIAGRAAASSDLLTPGEYKLLARHLRNMQWQPSDLLSPEADKFIKECQPVIDDAKLKRLLARGFLLSQAIERWQTRAIWVVSRADANYPRRLKTRLRENAPPVLYGCGDMAILDTGGLAVVGSRNVDEALVGYTEDIGRLAAKVNKTLVSGGARGIDQAAMRGALEGGGKVVGVLADSLEKTAMNREHRNMLINGQLVLISPYDPGAGFNVGHAMQRNKLIYALADAALVVSSDYQKGGTWAGAVEQLDKLKFVPVYIRSMGETEKGLDALKKKGALLWPNPHDSDVFAEALAAKPYSETGTVGQNELSFAVKEQPGSEYAAQPNPVDSQPAQYLPPVEMASNPAEELFTKVRELMQRMDSPKTDVEVAADLNVSKSQAKEWLNRLVDEGVLEKLAKPVRYFASSVKQTDCFEQLEKIKESDDLALKNISEKGKS